MQKVIFTHKSGRERAIPRRQADLLSRLGKGTYATRDMVAAPHLPASAEAVDLEAMDADALHALAKERGVKVHHAAGAAKVLAALQEAAK